MTKKARGKIDAALKAKIALEAVHEQATSASDLMPLDAYIAALPDPRTSCTEASGSLTGLSYLPSIDDPERAIRRSP